MRIYKLVPNLAAAIAIMALCLTAACSDDSSVAGPGMSATDAGQKADGGALDAAADAGSRAQDAGSQPEDAGSQGQDAGGIYLDISGHDAGPVIQGELLALTLDPPTATLPIGAALAFNLTGLFGDGSHAPLGAEAKWKSSDPKVLTVSSTGVATALTAGQAQVEASISGLLAMAKVTVTPLKISKLALEPEVAAVAPGATVAFSAIATLEDGSSENVSGSVQWKIGDVAVATIDSKGVVTGMGAGKTTVSASLGELQASAELEVTTAKLQGLKLTPVDPVLKIGGSVAFAVEASYDDGKIFEVTASAKWTSSAPSKVIVSDQGVATALAAGTAIIEAVYGGMAASRVVTVQAAKLTGLTLKPASATLAAGGVQVFSAWGAYDDGSEADLSGSALWSVTPAGLAAVSNAAGSQGTVTALAPGVAEVKAVFGALSATAKLSVTAAPLVSIDITPADPKVPTGIKTKLRAKGHYGDGKVLDITEKVVWQSADPKVATVSNATGLAGVLQGVAQGQTTVSAALGAVSGKTSVTVTAAALTGVVVAPASKSIPLGLTEAFTAQATYSDGSKADVTGSALWSSSEVKVAEVSNAAGSKGVVTGVAPGKAVLKAVFAGLSGSAQVEITAPKLVELTVGPHNLQRKAGQKVQYYAMAIYSNGQSQNVTTQVAWSSSKTSVAVIQTTGSFIGVVSAMAAGKTTISAKYGGLEASTTLTVTDPELVALQVTPATWESPVGMPMQFQAVAIFSDDTSQNVTFQANWSSSNSKVAAIGNQMGGPGGGNKGRTMGYQPGEVTLTATFKGATGTAKLKISPAQPSGLSLFPGAYTIPVGQFRMFEASLLYSDGTVVPANWQGTWSSSNNKVVAALNGMNQKGAVQALAEGTATITVTVEGFKATASVTVTKAEPKELQITPGVWKVAKGVPANFNVVAVFSDGTTQNVSGQATFTSSDPSVAAVFNGGPMGGVVQTLKAGKTDIKASWKGLSASAELTVTAAELKALQVTPTSPTVTPGSWAKFEAVAIYSDDTTQQVTGLASWSSSNNKVASVSNLQSPPGKGLAQALAAGKTTISASWGGKTGSSELTVQSAALIEIQVTPFAPVLPLGYLTAFRATGIFSDNTVQDLTGQSSWTSSNPTIASVTATQPNPGWVTPISAGTTEITAVFQGKKGVTKLTVTAAKLVSVSVSPATTTLAPMKEQAFTAKGTFDDGHEMDLTPWVLWQSDKAAVISVSNAWGSKGLGKALSVGQATVTAVRDGVSGKATVTVK